MGHVSQKGGRRATNPRSPERNVAVHRERDGVHELRRVGNEREERHAEELLVDPRALKNDVDDIDENFCKDFEDTTEQVLSGNIPAIIA